MEITLLTAEEANYAGLSHSRILHEGHGAFGEPDNSYEDVVRVGNKTERVSEKDLLLVSDREVLQVLSPWVCSDRLLELSNPKLLRARKEDKYAQFLKLKEELNSDPMYSGKI